MKMQLPHIDVSEIILVCWLKIKPSFQNPPLSIFFIQNLVFFPIFLFHLKCQGSNL